MLLILEDLILPSTFVYKNARDCNFHASARVFLHGFFSLYFLLVTLNSVAANEVEKPPTPVGFGPQPHLPEPDRSLIPTLHVATAKPWTGDAKPIAAAGFTVNAYARDLDHPRWLYVLPNGDILVAETSAPAKRDKQNGLKGWVQGKVMKRAGSATVSANRITLLRGLKADGLAETKSVFLHDLNSAFGMVLVGDNLYVANTDALIRFPYSPGQTEITAKGVKVIDLPAGEINHHWTKNIIADRAGKYLYVTVGSNSNIGERGMQHEVDRAAIWQVDLATGKARTFASGLRNPVGLAWQPQSGALWTTVNERDELGDDLVPDYMTEVKEGGFYGWPYSYFGQHIDPRVEPQQPDLVAKAITPDYALGAHTASLGLTFYEKKLFPEHYFNGVFIAQHGSWNRKPRSGYKVVFIPFSEDRPNGMPEDVLTGFLDQEGNAQGRPVGVAVDNAGALLVTDDVGNVVWRVTPVQRE